MCIFFGLNIEKMPIYKVTDECDTQFYGHHPPLGIQIDKGSAKEDRMKPTFYEKYYHVINKEHHAVFYDVSQKSSLALITSKKRLGVCTTSPELNIMPLELFIQRIAFVKFKCLKNR